MPLLGDGIPPLGGGGAELLSSLQAAVAKASTTTIRDGLIHRETESNRWLIFIFITLLCREAKQCIGANLCGRIRCYLWL